MKEETIFRIEGLYRDDFRVRGFFFGEGEKALCVTGSTRGNEMQQLYCASQLIQKLRRLEEAGRLVPGKQILVLPCLNPYSINVKKRFWPIDNTDINRMFPGYEEGETTQRIAGGVFNIIRDYAMGIQLASFYMPGIFVPHIRMMKTGFEDVELACRFGMPYVILHHPRPFDTATLNYNWQIWNTKAFSLYTTVTAEIDRKSAADAVDAILRFMSAAGLLNADIPGGFISRVMDGEDTVPVRAADAGFMEAKVTVGEHVTAGQTLAFITDSYTGELRQELTAPEAGIVGFIYDAAMVYQDTAVIKLLRDPEAYC